MNPPTQTRSSLERLRLYFASVPTRQGVLARRVLGQTAPDDESLSRCLVEALKRDGRKEGSATGTAVQSVWQLHELLDLGCAEQEPEFARVLQQVLVLQGRPGSFSQGCSRTRHAHRVCEHFISGFFSPAPPEQRLAPVMFPNGKVFRAEAAARFAVSCLAFRATLRSRVTQPALERHLASLLQLSEQWNEWNGYFAGDAIVAGIHALACVPRLDRPVRSRLATLIAEQQAQDGTWPHADLFATLDALRALGTAEAHLAIRRAVPALASRQRPDGSFGTTAQQERALIGARALIWAEEDG